jgi:DNA-binding response OmpR family regulator
VNAGAADSMIRKPFEIETLVATMARMVRRES